MVLAVMLSAMVLGGQGSSGSDDSNYSPVLKVIVPSFPLVKSDVRAAIKKLFKDYKTNYTIGDDVRGKVSFDSQNMTFEETLRQILGQVDATYRTVPIWTPMPDGGAIVADRVFLIRHRSRPGTQSPTSPEGVPQPSTMPNFIPGAYTSRYDFRNPALFTSPQRTKGGTLDLLLEAARSGEFGHWYVWSYGKNGLALVLPFEYIHGDGKFVTGGKSHRRFAYRAPYLFSFDFRKLGEYVANEAEWVPQHGRVIVLVASTEPITAAGVGTSQSVLRKDDPFDLPQAVRQQTWKGEVSLSALVYEFMGKSIVDPVRLIPPGKSKLTARDHLIGAELWTAGLI